MPEFLRFYGYTVAEALQEYAVTFNSLVNTMYRLKAYEAIDNINTNNASQEVVDNYRKQAKGLHGIVQEVNVVKAVKK